VPDGGGERCKKDDLDEESRTEGWNGTAGDGEAFARGFGVGGKDAEEHEIGADGDGKCDARNLHADGDEDFCDAGERDPERGAAELRRDHADEVGAALAPMCGRSEKEHNAESAAQCDVPAGEVGDGEAEKPKKCEGNDENDEGNHDGVVLRWWRVGMQLGLASGCEEGRARRRVRSFIETRIEAQERCC
jgi:hypothetical protein